MLRRAVRARDLAVGDVAHQDVLEGELRLARDRTAPCALHELLLLQRMETVLVDAERTEPEHLPQHRSDLQYRLLLRRERVEARGDDALHALGEILRAAALARPADVLR